MKNEGYYHTQKAITAYNYNCKLFSIKSYCKYQHLDGYQDAPFQNVKTVILKPIAA